MQGKPHLFMPKHYSKIIFLIIAFIFVFTVGYFKSTEPEALRDNIIHETTYQERPVLGALQPLPVITAINKDWVMLGEALFNSTLLSADNTISCASCHAVNSGGDDGFPVSIGVGSKTGTRNSPTVLNSSLNFRQFWDGRSLTLNDQAIGPIHNPVEMGSNFQQIIPKLKATPTFAKAFKDLDPNGVTEKNIIKAITTYEESLITHNSPIDKYLLGDDTALTIQQKRGLDKFQQFGCITCHQGRNIGGNLFQKIGRIDEAPPSLLKDKGRFNVTNENKDLHVYKVPSLRNVALTAPYFHDGSVGKLEDAVRLMGRMQLGIMLADDDVDDITALLKSFTGKVSSSGESQ